MIYDITPFSLIEYPDKISCIVWLAGCNMRCKYCYNEHIINATKGINVQLYEEFLSSRQGLLDAVVFSGGECTQSKNLKEYIKIAKKYGFLIKIDSNASNPNLISELIDENLVDYFAIDFKAPKEKFAFITGVDFFDEFSKSIDILIENNADFEIRTTWHFDLLCVEDIIKMNDFIKSKGYKNKYYLQKFLESKNIAGLSKSEKLVDITQLSDDFSFRNF